MKKAVLLMVIALCIEGCTYAISRDMEGKADKTVTFNMIMADPEAFKGKLVIFGGTIASVKNAKDGTVIEVIQKSLDYWGKPKRTDKSSGRFLVFYRGYLDSLVYSPGRDLTVAGEVAGTRQQTLGEIDFSYPLLNSKELKLWERPERSAREPKWWDPLYDPYGPETSIRP
jgi:outer membrane lipoprotein